MTRTRPQTGLIATLHVTCVCIVCYTHVFTESLEPLLWVMISFPIRTGLAVLSVNCSWQCVCTCLVQGPLDGPRALVTRAAARTDFSTSYMYPQGGSADSGVGPMFIEEHRPTAQN